MTIPSRCFTCKLTKISEVYLEFVKKTFANPEFDNHSFGKVMDDLGLKKVCCRAMVMTAVPDNEMIDLITKKSSKSNL